MFIYTIGDILGACALLIALAIWLATRLSTTVRQRRCSHDGRINETQACDAICGKCGKNLGFIGSVRAARASGKGGGE